MIAFSDERFAVNYVSLKAVAALSFICVILSGARSHASCPVDQVIVSGRVENAPAKVSVRVQLVYSNGKPADSAEATLETDSFRIEISFLTQSRSPVLIGTFHEKCDRKPTTVVVTLFEGEREYDRVFLNLAKDFKMMDSSAYALRSELLLHGPPPI
jgi:hypothetical protein